MQGEHNDKKKNIFLVIVEPQPNFAEGKDSAKKEAQPNFAEGNVVQAERKTK